MKKKKKTGRSKMVYKWYIKTYDFSKFTAIRALGDRIMKFIINMHMANDKQNHLAKYIKEFKNRTRPQQNYDL